MAVQTFTAVIHKEDDLYIADCPEVGTVSQGNEILLKKLSLILKKLQGYI